MTTELFDLAAAQEACRDVKQFFQLKDSELTQVAMQKATGYLDEDQLEEQVEQIYTRCTELKSFIQQLKPYAELTTREINASEYKLSLILLKHPSLNRRDISRIAALFSLLLTTQTAEAAVQKCLEFLVTITTMRNNNDDRSMFSIKSHDTNRALSPRPHTVCGANIKGALSPISEKSGIEYEPLEGAKPLYTQPTPNQPTTVIPKAAVASYQPFLPQHQIYSSQVTPTWHPAMVQSFQNAPQNISSFTQQPYHQHSALTNMHASSHEDHQHKLQELEQYAKLKANLIRGAPQFDGKSDFDVFVTTLHEYLQELPYMTEQLRKSILKSSCKGVAQEYLGTIPALAAQSFDCTIQYLQQRFGRDLLRKKLTFDALTQSYNESLQEFADRVQRGAIGTQRSNEEVINRFILGLRDKALAEKLAMHDFLTIPQVLAKAEKCSSVRSRGEGEFREKRYHNNIHNNDTRHNRNDIHDKMHNGYNKDKQKQTKPFPNKGKPFQKIKDFKKANQIEQQEDSDSDIAPLNNLVEVFQLSSDDFQNTIDEVLAARADKPPQMRYNLRSTGGVEKNTNTSDNERQSELIRQAIFVPKETVPAIITAPPDQEMQDIPSISSPPQQQQQLPPPVTQNNPPIYTRQYIRREKRVLPAPALQPLYGDKPTIGDYLALLVGNNEFQQKVLIQELKNRYYEITTVPKSSQNIATAQIVTTPPKRSPLQYHMVKLGSSSPIAACADTGAEISLITTAALQKANFPFVWDELNEGYPVKGISSVPQSSKTLVTSLTFLHDIHPLTIRAAFSVIQSPDYRFLIGRDLLRPLKYNLNDTGLTLTAPKSGQETLFPYSDASAFMLSQPSMPSINTTEQVLKGEQKAKNLSPILNAAYFPIVSQSHLTQSHCNSSESDSLPNLYIRNNSQSGAQDTKGDCEVLQDTKVHCEYAPDFPIYFSASHDKFGNPIPSVLRQMLSHEQGRSELYDTDPIQFPHFECLPVTTSTKGDKGDLHAQINTAQFSFDPSLLRLKTYLAQPVSQNIQQYTGEELTDILQIEQLFVNQDQSQSFRIGG